jgi:alanine dehydrogenase
MLVGVPREIKDNEYRVGIVPSTVREFTENGHQVSVERQGQGQDSEIATIKVLGPRSYLMAMLYSAAPN